MPFEFNLIAGRDMDFSGTLEDANGNAITIQSGSDVILKLYRGAGATPDLDVNGTALAGGTVTTFSTASTAPNQGTWTVKFFSSDTSGLTPGTYDAEVELVDAGDSNRVKPADRGVVHILGQPLGKVT